MTVRSLLCVDTLSSLKIFSQGRSHSAVVQRCAVLQSMARVPHITEHYGQVFESNLQNDSSLQSRPMLSSDSADKHTLQLISSRADNCTVITILTWDYFRQPTSTRVSPFTVGFRHLHGSVHSEQITSSHPKDLLWNLKMTCQNETETLVSDQRLYQCLQSLSKDKQIRLK